MMDLEKHTRVLVAAALMAATLAGCALSPQQQSDLKRYNDARDAQMLAGNKDRR
ncbi:MAG: hypothetical protein ACRCWO_12005 [Bosea sp. (in: a-proteobacteria)]